VVQKTLSRILGCALLLYGNTALAFTLIELEVQVSPSNTVLDSYTFGTKVQPITGAIRGQINSHRRPRNFQKVTQLGGTMFAANAHSNSSSDAAYVTATDVSSGAGSGSSGSGSDDDTDSLWVSTMIDSLENTFSRTAFHGTTQNVIVGLDFTRSNQHIFGISGSYETSEFNTAFNAGDERTQGVNFNPYFAWLLSDAWTLDLIGGYGKFNTDQSRTVAVVTVPLSTAPVTSKFSSTRSFASTNLTNISAFGNWKLTGSLGYLWSKRESDAYTESNGSAQAESEQTSRQWNLLGEVAYGRGNSETFFGARYEDILNYQNVELATGEQPANDPNGFLLTAGWRHFGKDLSANFVLNTRLGQEQIRQYGFSMLLRVNL
jgi:hypothetical protein